MLQFADRAWSDEQKEFKCNTKEPGWYRPFWGEFKAGVELVTPGELVTRTKS